MSGVEHSYSFSVDSREVDWQDHMRPSSLLAHLQEAAVIAAEQLKVDRDRMIEKYNCFWMLARIWYRLERPLRYGEAVTIRTWHRGGRGASMYRDFDLLAGEEPVGEAVSVWVLADVDTRQLMRFSNVEECREDSSGGALCKSMQLSALKLPADMTEQGNRRLYYSDTDINGHVNNSHYADFACDALHMERREQGVFVSELQVCYLAECRPGEELHLRTGQQNGMQFVCGVDGENKPRFTAALTLQKAEHSPLDSCAQEA